MFDCRAQRLVEDWRYGIEQRLHVRGIDLLDGTPVLDIKPYVPYADAFPDARAGWLDEINQPPDAPDRFE